MSKSVEMMRCYVRLPGATWSSWSVVGDSGRPINWLNRERRGGGGVIQVAVAVEAIWVKIDYYLGRNGRGSSWV